MNELNGVTLLWALRSPCNLICQYCYFGTVEELNDSAESFQPGKLSHVSRNDVSLDEILSFIASFAPDTVSRVFIAGGEPLVWPGTQRVVEALKAAHIDVIVCTNGLPLADKSISKWLIRAGVDAISVSLDSYDWEYNDQWRVDRSGQGWHGVVKGIKTIIRERNDNNSQLKVGIYSVISQLNIEHISLMGRFVAELGADYFIIQPISLIPSHRLHERLSLDSRHNSALADAIKELEESGLRIHLPDKDYLRLVLKSLSIIPPSPFIQECSGGRDFFFIEPDGSVWDCPSMYKIADTPPSKHLSIARNSAIQLFSAKRQMRNADCPYFSSDCVNTWQLMAFNDILG